MKRVLSLALVSSAIGLGAPTAFASTAASTAVPTVTVSTTTSGTHFTATKLSVPAGKQFLLVFRNLTSGQHNVSLEQGELEYGATLTIGKGSTASIFILKPGAYHFYSSVGNDENTGMSGTLIAK